MRNAEYTIDPSRLDDMKGAFSLALGDLKTIKTNLKKKKRLPKRDRLKNMFRCIAFIQDNAKLVVGRQVKTPNYRDLVVKLSKAGNSVLSLIDVHGTDEFNGACVEAMRVKTRKELLEAQELVLNTFNAPVELADYDADGTSPVPVTEPVVPAGDLLAPAAPPTETPVTEQASDTKDTPIGDVAGCEGTSGLVDKARADDADGLSLKQEPKSLDPNIEHQASVRANVKAPKVKQQTLSMEEGLRLAAARLREERLEREKALSKAFEQVKSLTSEESAAKTEKTESSKASKRETDLTNQDVRSLAKYATFRSKIPKKLDKSFIVRRLPVIAVFNKSVPLDKLAAMGFVVNDVSNYPVLENQLILGVDPNVARERVAKRKKIWRSDHALEHVRKNLLTIVNERTGKTHNFMSETPFIMPSSPYVYFWIVPEKRVTKLSNDRTQVVNWSFAFK